MYPKPKGFDPLVFLDGFLFVNIDQPLFKDCIRPSARATSPVDVYVVTNNPVRGKGIANALRLRREYPDTLTPYVLPDVSHGLPGRPVP